MNKNPIATSPPMGAAISLLLAPAYAQTVRKALVLHLQRAKSAQAHDEAQRVRDVLHTIDLKTSDSAAMASRIARMVKASAEGGAA